MFKYVAITIISFMLFQSIENISKQPTERFEITFFTSDTTYSPSDTMSFEMVRWRMIMLPEEAIKMQIRTIGQPKGGNQ